MNWINGFTGIKNRVLCYADEVKVILLSLSVRRNRIDLDIEEEEEAWSSCPRCIATQSKYGEVCSVCQEIWHQSYLEEQRLEQEAEYHLHKDDDTYSDYYE